MVPVMTNWVTDLGESSRSVDGVVSGESLQVRQDLAQARRGLAGAQGKWLGETLRAATPI
jgi:hypothetical protein